MAKLADVNYSLHGTAQTVVSKMQKDISGLVKFDAKNPPKDDPDWVIFKLVDTNKKGGVYLPSIDDVIDPRTGQVERIRLLAGVPTIWQKEQKDVSPEYVKKNLRNIEFPRGIKIRRVAKHDKTLLEFLRMTNANVGNVNRIGSSRFEIYEYDFAAAEKEAYERENFELEMAILAKQADPKKMWKHAAFLGIRLINDLGERKSDDGVRKEYVMYAKRNPDYFKRTMDTEQIEVSWLVRKGIADSLIEVHREPGKAFWAQGGGMIAVMPKGANPQDYLTELAMTNNEEGRNFKEQLKKVVS